MKSKTTKVRRYLAAILTVLMIFQQATTSVIYASSEAAVPTVTEAPAAQTEETPEKQVEETPEEKIPTEGESEQTETSTQDSADKQQEQTEEAQPTEEPQTEEAVTPAPETEIVSNEAPAVEMEAAALSAGTEESNNVPSATNTDLPSAWVKSQSVQKETNGSTTLIVAQRISTILHADQIIVLDEGNIVGKGTHEELLNTCPVYQQIAKSQLSEDDLKKAREVSDHE